MTEFWPEPPPGAEVIRLVRRGAPVHFVQYARRRPASPVGARRPRVRISRHAIDHALHVAAFGSHVCRPFPVLRPGGSDLGDSVAEAPGGRRPGR